METIQIYQVKNVIKINKNIELSIPMFKNTFRKITIIIGWIKYIINESTPYFANVRTIILFLLTDIYNLNTNKIQESFAKVLENWKKSEWAYQDLSSIICKNEDIVKLSNAITK